VPGVQSWHRLCVDYRSHQRCSVADQRFALRSGDDFWFRDGGSNRPVCLCGESRFQRRLGIRHRCCDRGIDTSRQFALSGGIEPSRGGGHGRAAATPGSNAATTLTEDSNFSITSIASACVPDRLLELQSALSSYSKSIVQSLLLGIGIEKIPEAPSRCRLRQKAGNTRIHICFILRLVLKTIPF
jgi:hypothetical protein